MSEFDWDNNDADNIIACSLKSLKDSLKTNLHLMEEKKELLFYRKDTDSSAVLNPLISKEVRICLQRIVPEVVAEVMYAEIEEYRSKKGEEKLPQEERKKEIKLFIGILEGVR